MTTDGKLRATLDATRAWLMFQCPGCEELHGVRVAPSAEKGPVWNWNGSLTSPTLTPSLLLKRTEGEERRPFCCHSFVTEGRIQFLGDCTHKLRGQTVEIPPIEDAGSAATS